MALSLKLSHGHHCTKLFLYNAPRFFSTRPIKPASEHEEDEFRVLNLRPLAKPKAAERRKFRRDEPLPPRFKEMEPTQDWGNVWPAPRTFHPATVPLPVRQGFTEGGKAPPGKFVNAELMKVPNFLHLTPPVIKRQCEALKKFCTPWPQGLETFEKIEKHFPVKVISSDYCMSSPTIRNPLARIVSIKLNLSILNLDEHALDKFLRLAKERYNPETDELTLVSDRCPLKKQNYDYSMYLLTALCHESKIKEPWEDTKSIVDMEKYIWNLNKSKETSEDVLNWGKSEKNLTASKKYVDSVERLMNEGENRQNLDQYKLAVLEMLGLKHEVNEIKLQGEES